MRREAVVRQMKRRSLTTYRLWQMAQVHYPSLSQAAVHEFLKGQRQFELPSVEALLAAAELRIVRRKTTPRGKPRRAPKQGAKKSES